jgi:alanyl aminopeptidase
LPNAGTSGYYLSALDDAAFARLWRNVARLTVPERMQFLYDTSAAARAGALDYAHALELLPLLALDRDRHVVVAALHAVDFLRDDNFFPDELRPRFAKFVRDVFGRRAHALGFAERKSDDDDTRMLRPPLLYVVADQGEDPELREEGKRVALRWLEDHSSTSPELANVALHLAAISGDRAFFDRLHEAARKEKDRVERQRMLDALGGFRDPAIAQAALPIALSDEFDPRESIALVWSAAESAETRDLALDFVKKNFLALVARMPRDWGAGAVGVARGFCDEKAAKDVADFFGPRARRFAGGERRFAQAIENLRQCAAFRASATPGVTAFLQRR